MNFTMLLVCWMVVMLAADVAAEPPEGFWPAIRKGDEATVRALLRADGTLVRARMANGTSPILLAMYAGHAKLAQVFLEFGASPDYWEAAAMGDLAVVKQWMAADAALLNRNGPDGYGALGLAIFFEHEDVARWLIAQGADPNVSAANPAKAAPIHAATARGNAALVDLLLRKGARPDLAQAQGFTALHEAAARGDEAIVTLLLKHGASKWQRTEDGRIAADFAREKGHAVIESKLR